VTKKEADEVKRLFGVVAEDLRSEIRQVAEGVGLLNERFDGHEGRFDRLEGRFDGLEGRFDGLEGRFDGLEGRFDRLEGRFDGLDAKVDRMGRELTAEIRQVAGAQADLRERVARLESDRP
jgi:predicted nuclease with TOPRIM domain